MKSHSAADALARTVAVNPITIGQVFYFLNSRYLLDSLLSLNAHLGNKYRRKNSKRSMSSSRACTGVRSKDV
jgi:hypothetical protein